MEQNFQTSFIPQKPMTEERVSVARPIGLLAIISILILFTVLLATGGLYFYRGIMLNRIDEMKNGLDLAKNRFEPSKITELQALERRLNASSEVLSKHIAITPIFQELQAITMKTVRYTNFDYLLGTETNPKITVKLKGQAAGYSSVALQSDLLTQNEHLVDPVFSNLLLNDKGDVLFDLEFLVDPSFVDYKQMLERGSAFIESTADGSTDTVPVTPDAPTTPAS